MVSPPNREVPSPRATQTDVLQKTVLRAPLGGDALGPLPLPQVTAASLASLEIENLAPSVAQGFQTSVGGVAARAVSALRDAALLPVSRPGPRLRGPSTHCLPPQAFLVFLDHFLLTNLTLC